MRGWAQWLPHNTLPPCLGPGLSDSIRTRRERTGWSPVTGQVNSTVSGQPCSPEGTDTQEGATPAEGSKHFLVPHRGTPILERLHRIRTEPLPLQGHVHEGDFPEHMQGPHKAVVNQGVGVQKLGSLASVPQGVDRKR